MGKQEENDNFSCLGSCAREECEAWVKRNVMLILNETGRIGPETYRVLREAWANGYLAGKHDERYETAWGDDG